MNLELRVFAYYDAAKFEKDVWYFNDRDGKNVEIEAKTQVFQGFSQIRRI
jgi:hypothetical protein